MRVSFSGSVLAVAVAWTVSATAFADPCGSAFGTWSQLATQQVPAARQTHSATYDPLRQQMIVFGGTTTGVLGDTWSLDLAADSGWKPLSFSGATPPARYGHGAIYDAANDRVVLFGGFGNDARNDTWALSLTDPPTWSELAPAGPVPPARFQHATIYDARRGRMVVFGGWTSNSGTLNDVWALDLTGAGSWSELAPAGTPPPTGIGFQAAYDSTRDRMIMFGGSQTWDLTLGGTPTWHQLPTSGTPPTPDAFGHSLILDPTRDRLFVFGGEDTPVDDIARQHNRSYALTLSDQVWSELTPCSPPPGRYLHSAIYDAAHDRMVVFGGSDPQRSDTWLLSFPAASGITPHPRQEPFQLAAIAPNPAPGVVVCSITLRNPARIALEIFDTQGRRVGTVARGELTAGRHALAWSAASRVAPGAYLARFSYPGGQAIRRFALIR